MGLHPRAVRGSEGDPENTWEAVHKEIAQLDELINEFNAAVL